MKLYGDYRQVLVFKPRWWQQGLNPVAPSIPTHLSPTILLICCRQKFLLRGFTDGPSTGMAAKRWEGVQFFWAPGTSEPKKGPIRMLKNANWVVNSSKSSVIPFWGPWFSLISTCKISCCSFLPYLHRKQKSQTTSNLCTATESVSIMSPCLSLSCRYAVRNRCVKQ
jgi:hypothetical protein